MAVTTSSREDVFPGSAATEPVDVRPILLRSAQNAWEHTEKTRADLYLTLERLCRQRGFEALVLQSYRYVHPAWVKFESWQPTDKPGITARASLLVSIYTKPYHRFETVYKVEWTKHGQNGSLDDVYQFGETELDQLLTIVAAAPAHALARRAIRRILRGVQLRQNSYEFWKPRNRVRAVRRDWLRTLSFSAILLGLLLLIPAFAGDSDDSPSPLSLLGPAPPEPAVVGSEPGPEPIAEKLPPAYLPTGPSLQVGTLDAAGPLLDDGRIYEARTLTLEAGSPVVVTMQSSDFDTLITIGELRGGSFIALASNDDAVVGSTNSRLEFVSPSAGQYIVLFSSYEAGKTGTYTYALEY